jgi:hypothetical protein
MTGLDKAVNQVMYKHLPKLICKSERIQDASLDKDYARIPLLTELLDEFPHYPMQIDLKGCSEAAVLKVGNLIHKYDRVDTTLWGSFEYSTSAWIFKNYGNSIPRFMPFYRIIFSRILYNVGLLSWMDMGESALIIHERILHNGYVRAMQEKGIRVLVFGDSLVSFSAYDRVYSYGIDAICTDTPGLLKEWLLERKIKLL